MVADLDPATVIDGDLPATARGVIAEFGRRVYQKLIGLKVTDLYLTVDDLEGLGAALTTRGIPGEDLRKGT